MAGSFPNSPRLTKGALVDTNIVSVPPLVVPFQFNPEQVTRRRSASIQESPARVGRERFRPLHESFGETQTVVTGPETISLEVRLDATDRLERGDGLAAQYGVLPALSALELMITPRAETFFGGLLELSLDHGLGDRSNPPVLVFVWGSRVDAVRITDMTITEVEYRPNLAPSRVTVGLDLHVLSGPNPFSQFMEIQRELLATLNLRDAPELASVVNLPAPPGPAVVPSLTDVAPGVPGVAGPVG